MEAMVPAPAEKESSGGRPAKKRRYDSTNWSSHWFFCKFIKQNVIRTLLFFQFYVQQVRFISVDQSIKARLPEYKIPEQHDNFKILKFSIQIQNQLWIFAKCSIKSRCSTYWISIERPDIIIE